MTIIRRIGESFGLTARPAEPEDRPLRDALRHSFCIELDNTVARLREVMEAMGLPLPRRGGVMTGAEGGLLFLNDYGLVMRIERSDDLMRTTRIENHPMVLQPLGQRAITPYAVLEICPGCNITTKREDMELLKDNLPKTGVRLWDFQVCNTGLLPVRLPEYPNGVPVVIDRLAVDRLSNDITGVKDALEVFNLRSDPQHMIYADLKKAFADAWPQGEALPDRDKFKTFLDLSIRAKSLGYLVSGWARDPNAPDTAWMYEDVKRSMAANAGEVYAKQIKALHAV